MFRYVRHVKVAKLVFRARLHYFAGPEPPTSFFARTHPITSVRPKTTFGSVLERFGTFGTKKLQNSCFGPECTVLRVRNLRRAFFARTHPITSVRPKTMFRSVLERFGTFGTKMFQNSCFWAKCTILQVRNLRRAFSPERTE